MKDKHEPKGEIFDGVRIFIAGQTSFTNPDGSNFSVLPDLIQVAVPGDEVKNITELFPKGEQEQVKPFHVWYRFVKKLVEEDELTDPNYDLPTGILRDWYAAGKTPQDAAHMIAHDGI